MEKQPKKKKRKQNVATWVIAVLVVVCIVVGIFEIKSNIQNIIKSAQNSEKILNEYEGQKEEND